MRLNKMIVPHTEQSHLAIKIPTLYPGLFFSSQEDLFCDHFCVVLVCEDSQKNALMQMFKGLLDVWAQWAAFT